MKMPISPGVSWLYIFLKKPNFIAIGEKVVIFEVVCAYERDYFLLCLPGYIVVATHDISKLTHRHTLTH